MLQVGLASRRLVRTPFAFLPAKRRKVIPAISSYGGALSTAVPHMVTKMVRHYDQNERQSDASLHWDAMRPVLLRAFANHGARDFSDEQWIRLVHEGSSKTRFEYWLTFEHFQGHSGGIPIDPELMRYIRIPYNWKEYIFTRVALSASNLPLRTH